MRIVLITQDEELYLYGPLKSFLDHLNEDDEVVACVLLSPSASGSGRGVTFFSRAMLAAKVFGIKFFCLTALRFIARRLWREPTVRSLFVTAGIELIELEHSINHSESIRAIRQARPELLISIQGNEIFKEEFLGVAPCLNVHSAPLPRYRGLMPIFWALHNQEVESAVSVFMVDKGIDSGPIVCQRSFSLVGLGLHDAIQMSKSKAMECLLEALDYLRAGGKPSIENNDDESTYYSFPTRGDVKEFLRRGGRF